MLHFLSMEQLIRLINGSGKIRSATCDIQKREIIMQHDLDIFFIYDKRTLSFALWDFAFGYCVCLASGPFIKDVIILL